MVSFPPLQQMEVDKENYLIARVGMGLRAEQRPFQGQGANVVVAPKTRTTPNVNLIPIHVDKMAKSTHSCHDSDGLYCGQCTGPFDDASCCAQFTETYTPRSGAPRTRCITSTQSSFGTGKPVGADLEIAVLTGNMAGADGSQTKENPQIDSFGDLARHLGNSLVIPTLIIGGVTFVLLRILK